MSIGFSGLDTPCCVHPVTIEVSPTHPLLQLARVIPWQTLADLVLPDLKRTTPKGKWWLGRKLTLRIHLGAFLLQWLYNLTDRQVEWALKDNAAYQLFCGRGLVAPWHAPDHTKIEEFRSRLSPETQRQMANVVAVWATELGLADPSAMDIDSTVQEANMAYPSDAHLMVKMTLLVHKVWTYMKQHISFFADFIPCVDVKAVKAKARAYLFRDRKEPEHAQTTFQELWHEAFTQIHHVRKYFDILLDYDRPMRRTKSPKAALPGGLSCGAPGLCVSDVPLRGSRPHRSSVGEEGAIRVPLTPQAQESLGPSAWVRLTERVDAVALLLGQMGKRGWPEVWDRPLPRPGTPRGRSWGGTAVLGRASRVTAGDHRPVSVATALQGLPHPRRRRPASGIAPLDVRAARRRPLRTPWRQPAAGPPLAPALPARSLAVDACSQGVRRWEAPTGAGEHAGPAGGR